MITEQTVQTTVGWLIIVSHLFLIGYIFVIMRGLLSGEQTVGLLLSLGPVATAYFVAVIKTFIADKRKGQSKRVVSMNYAAIGVLLPTCFVAAIFWLLVSYPSEIVSDVSVLQRWISGIEVALGGTVGMLVADLFPSRTA